MKRPYLMGILNVTPDSFFDGGRYFKKEDALKHIEEMLDAKVDIIDVGAESTRPGSERISAEEDWKRLEPILQIFQEKSLPFSIDTMHPTSAEKAIEMGATLINDVSGFREEKMQKIAKTSKAEICVMHMLGEPKSMQKNPKYPKGVMYELMDFFEKKISMLVKQGIPKERIIIDPGIGFGKTLQDNLLILKNLFLLKKFKCRTLIGLSRKSFMKKILKKNPDELLPATLVMNTIALMGGADIIRVHDVYEHRDLIDLFSCYQFEVM